MSTLTPTLHYRRSHRPAGVDLLIVRLGSALVSWGMRRAERTPTACDIAREGAAERGRDLAALHRQGLLPR
ncbi:hypothetical protein SAMN04489806_2731 [Paramicrobacterium humi]|uniref:Uncharacterized protein n=1 Tax=Paramicrobacterium humi TaxID=640635 RepID=A0A1H4Q6W8_9MICO|nr:hypothetical protein [Microbacterium humi]SEC15376.1 hypothetical protein SAMN04489806_2731 [Microbacterium humi]